MRGWNLGSSDGLTRWILVLKGLRGGLKFGVEGSVRGWSLWLSSDLRGCCLVLRADLRLLMGWRAALMVWSLGSRARLRERSWGRSIV